MEGRITHSRTIALVALVAVLATSYEREISVEQLPTVDETLAQVGRRLSRAHSAEEMTTLAMHGARVLAALTRSERDVLGRGYLRFQVDRPVEVFVAAPQGFEPFWLTDQKFRQTNMTLSGAGSGWTVSRKRVAAGWVGLGVNGLDRRAPAHYAVFLRALDGQPITPSHLDPHWQSTSASKRVFLESYGADGRAEVPVALVGSSLLRTQHDRRHTALLLRGRAWKTHVVSSSLPDQVVVSFGADPQSELVWSWRTATEVKSSTLHVRESSGKTWEIPGVAARIEMSELINDPSIRRYSARLTGLAPETTYEYWLGDGREAGITTPAKVRTAPRSTSDVALLYMGDPQCGLEGWGKLLASAFQKRPDAAALLIAGDLVDRGNERSNWDHFFLRAAGVFDRLPVLPAVGNHEYLDRGPVLYRAFFTLPENGPQGVAPELAYSVEIGDAFLAVLDSTAAVSSLEQARIQAEWLDDRLSRTARTWKLVMLHHPVYGTHPWRESPALRDAWVPVFDRHRVDLVLQGHDHAYQRTYPLRANRRAESPSEGTVYVEAVSGDKYVEQTPRWYTEVGFADTSTYQTIDIRARERRLIYRAFDVSGRELDAFTIEKPRVPPSLATRPGSGVRAN
jgi:acid phosphatase type 7